MRDFQAVRSRLSEELEALQKRQARVDRDLSQPQDRDTEEQALQLENDEVLKDLEAQGRSEMAQIERALRAIDAGRYGVCESCGEEIDDRRLEALPFAVTCIDCA